MPNTISHHSAVSDVSPAHPLEMTVPLEAHDLRLHVKDDSRVVLDATNQVAGHRIGEASRADQHVHFPDGLRQEYGGLARRVAGAHDNHVFTSAELRLHG